LIKVIKVNDVGRVVRDSEIRGVRRTVKADDIEGYENEVDRYVVMMFDSVDEVIFFCKRVFVGNW